MLVGCCVVYCVEDITCLENAGCSVYFGCVTDMYRFLSVENVGCCIEDGGCSVEDIRCLEDIGMLC